jgi:hypothetical protein
LTISINADVPQLINYQGRLTDSGENPVADDSYLVVFTIYDAATAGNSKWTETQSITTSSGLFAVLLGSINPIVDTVFNGTTRYLSIEVAGDPELLPRTALVTVPYAQRVSTVDGASGGNVTSKLSIGPGHTLSGDSAGISGGYNNVASGDGSSVGGGGNNSAVGQDASVAGGQNNNATAYCSSVGGGGDNTAASMYATVGGGTNNSVTNGYSTIAGGIQNSVSGNYSAILGGFADTITSSYSYLFGINANLSQDSTFRVDMPHIQFGSDDSSYEFPTGDGTSGQVMTTNGSGQLAWTSVEGSGGGSGWTDDGTVVRLDLVSDSVGIGTTTPTAKLDVDGDMVLSGKATFGPTNTNTGVNSFVFGKSNNASGDNATISGGWMNTASGLYQSTVSGGAANTSSHTAATVGGGQSNTASSTYSTVGGGFTNTAGGNSATVSGGYHSTADGDYSFTVGYADSISADADYSVLFGIGSKLTQDSTFMVDMPHVRIGNEADGFELPTTDGTTGQVMTTNGSGQVNWSSLETGEGSSNWTESGGVLYTNGPYGIARSNSTVWGSNNDSTHINLGVNSTTGAFGFDYKYLTISGGYMNTASGDLSTIGGGANNNSSDSATISGGYNNTASGILSTIGGGRTNLANGNRATIGGGSNNNASDSATVAGGYSNSASGDGASVGGGLLNEASGLYATVGGGKADTASSSYATVGGGRTNIASSISSTVSGGSTNTSSGSSATIGGGSTNTASGSYATIGGGYTNTSSGDNAAIGGGTENIADGYASTVGGGNTNNASGSQATIGGGSYNTASGLISTISGGNSNEASSKYATIGGGQDNKADSGWATISGGLENTTNSFYATVGGGRENIAGSHATVGGGYWNDASGAVSTICGGSDNVASGNRSIVCGGSENVASGQNSFAAGRQAKALHSGSFVWSDYNSADSLYSTADNQFVARASGGVKFYSNHSKTSGVWLLPGAGAWVTWSDSTFKENIRPVDGDDILDKISELDITRWNYESQDASIEHIGPMAQDFHRLFGVGDNNTTISTIDPDGISLAAIKALIEKNDDLEESNEELRERLVRLERLVEQLSKK